jgi:hypothetical protein
VLKDLHIGYGDNGVIADGLPESGRSRNRSPRLAPDLAR